MGRDTRIYRARLDGGSRTTLVSGLAQPVTALAVDNPSSTLYWMTFSSIESIDFYGKNRFKLFQFILQHLKILIINFKIVITVEFYFRREVVRDNLSKVGNLAISGGSLLWIQGSKLISHNIATGRNRAAFTAHYPITALAAVSSTHTRSDTWACLGGERVESPLECPDTGSSGYCDSNHYTCPGVKLQLIYPLFYFSDLILVSFFYKIYFT